MVFLCGESITMPSLEFRCRGRSPSSFRTRVVDSSYARFCSSMCASRPIRPVGSGVGSLRGGDGSGGGPCGRPPCPSCPSFLLSLSRPAGPHQDTRKGPLSTSPPLPPLRDDVPSQAVLSKRSSSERVGLGVVGTFASPRVALSPTTRSAAC